MHCRMIAYVLLLVSRMIAANYNSRSGGLVLSGMPARNQV